MSLNPYYEKDGVVIYNDNYENVLEEFSQNTFDLILTDPPYGTTQCEWDTMPNLENLWKLLKPIGKDNCAYVFTAAQPFTSKLVMSNLEWFKYDWVWDKINKFSGHLNAKKQPFRITESILVFYQKQCVYNPIFTEGKPYSVVSIGNKSSNYGKQSDHIKTINTGQYYPKNLISIKGNERGREGRIHPTQKPIELMEYMIKTYTNEGDIILDPFMGSGTTLVAAKKLNRKVIGIEISEKYCEIAARRLDEILKM